VASRPSGGRGAAVWLAPLALAALAVIGLVLVLSTPGDGSDDTTVIVGDQAPAVVPAEAGLTAGLDDSYGPDVPGEGMMMDTVAMVMDTPEPVYGEPPPSAAPAARADRLPSGETRVVVEAYGRTYRFPRTLSRSTSVGSLRHRVLAGRDVVEFEARDARWATTYYWEYGTGAAHFVASDGNLTNVSREPDSEAVLRAALGYMPERTFRTAEERTAERGASAPSASVRTGPAYVILGAYQTYDQGGLDERRRRVAASGYTIQTAMSQELGMNPSGLRILYLGPFDRPTAERIRDQMRAYASDAYLRSVDR
jgi:hypothetical protein